MAQPAPDLTRQPPRSPRVRLGGFILLPRMLDKGRAALAGIQGEYKFGCPLDQRLLEFVGVSANALKQRVAQGGGDADILAWLLESSPTKSSAEAIAAWSTAEEQRVPADVESREFFHNLLKQCAPHREDIATWFDLLDVDDYVSFGGQA